MNVIKVFGGLGNQMFQYAFGQVLERQTGEETAYEIDHFRRGRDRRYGLEEFRCSPKTVSRAWALRNTWWQRLLGQSPVLQVVDEPHANRYTPALLELKNSYVRGYFQVARYYGGIRETLLDDFRLKECPPAFAALREEVRSCESVSLHVRRGDYVDLGQDLQRNDPGYYRRAMTVIRERVANPRFYVFSDDIAWARGNLGLTGDVRYVDPVDPDRPVFDMMLMSSCRHNITANSSFSWWAAWLNENPAKLVVAPRTWTAQGGCEELVPAEWTRV